MKTTPEPPTYDNLEEYRIRASRLLKELRSDDVASALAAAERIGRLPAFAGRSSAEILASRETVARKHALAAVAAEAGFESWPALKASYACAAPVHFDTTQMFQPATRGFLNRWFARYEQARSVLDVDPGCFLFPYRSQYFICEANFLESLGVNPSDPDWALIGHDWARPADQRAWARLCVKMRGATRKSSLGLA